MKRWPISLMLGLGLMTIGAGPLITFLVADQVGLIRDPAPNPIGLGLLFAFTFWPALALVVFGLIRRAGRKS
jgi:hypothetical protein